MSRVTSTALKATKKPSLENQSTVANAGEMTVEEYLTMKCNEVISDLNAHGAELIARLQQQHREGAAAILDLISANTSEAPKLFVILKCIGGSHFGQNFRLEPGTGNGEDTFKLGRSTGKAFKEKGVSLYKDKEISTTHAKVEIRNGQVFLTDVRSTNGTLLNGDHIEPQIPQRLKQNDVMTLGTCELQVHISTFEDGEISE